MKLDNVSHKFCTIHISAYCSKLHGNEQVGLSTPLHCRVLSPPFFIILSHNLMGSHLTDGLTECNYVCLDSNFLDKNNISRSLILFSYGSREYLICSLDYLLWVQRWRVKALLLK